MLMVFIWDQLKYDIDMVYLIVILGCLEVYLFLFCVLPEKYCFCAKEIEIRHVFRRKKMIQYESVFNYEASIKDSLINITENNTVKLYYQVENRKYAVICRPIDVADFVEIVRKKCPEFCTEHDINSRLNVFINNK